MKFSSKILWVGVAITSGFCQTILIIAGTAYIRDAIPEESSVLKAVFGFAPFFALWALVWPIYAYAGMKGTYRELLQQEADRRSKAAHDQNAEQGVAPNP